MENLVEFPVIWLIFFYCLVWDYPKEALMSFHVNFPLIQFLWMLSSNCRLLGFLILLNQVWLLSLVEEIGLNVWITVNIFIIKFCWVSLLQSDIPYLLYLFILRFPTAHVYQLPHYLKSGWGKTISRVFDLILFILIIASLSYWLVLRNGLIKS